jgi:hypothetical protein
MSGISLSMRLHYPGPKRLMTVAYAPSSTGASKPMIRIANKYLAESGFTVGSKIEAEYGNGIITITKNIMNNATYYRKPPVSVVSPYQIMKKQMSDTNSDEHPARKEIQRVVGTYQLTAEVKEDANTLSDLAHVPGIIAFICNVKRDGELIGTGRGSAVLNGMSKFIARTVHFAFNSSVLNAVAQSTKAIDSMANPNVNELGIEETGQDSVMSEGITDKQRSYLTTLVRKNVNDPDTVVWWMNQLNEMDSRQASDAIKSFVK